MAPVSRAEAVRDDFPLQEPHTENTSSFTSGEEPVWSAVGPTEDSLSAEDEKRLLASFSPLARQYIRLLNARHDTKVLFLQASHAAFQVDREAEWRDQLRNSREASMEEVRMLRSHYEREICAIRAHAEVSGSRHTSHILKVLAERNALIAR